MVLFRWRPIFIVICGTLATACSSSGDDDDSGSASSSSSSGGSGINSSSSGPGAPSSSSGPALAACAFQAPGNSALATPLTAANTQDFLDAHNRARCHALPTPSAMPALTWDTALAAVAQAYANRCVWEHNSNRTSDYAAAGGSGYVGENLYASAPSAPNAADVVDSWASESADYDFTANTCSGVCGHYTQVVWAGTARVGCAQATCPNGLQGATSLNHVVVCDYAPGGNMNGQRPYVAAP